MFKVVGTRMARGLPYALLLLTFGYLWHTVFSTEPFVEREMLFIATFWTDARTSFLTTLFDPLKMDESCGNFPNHGV